MFDTSVRWSGLALAAGALILGAVFVLALFQTQEVLPTSPMATVVLIASILIILSLPGMYARQSDAAGSLGLLGYVLLMVGMLPFVVYAAAPMFFPEIKGPTKANAGGILLGTAWLVGLMLTGIATLRAQVYPRWSSILLLGSGVGFMFVFSILEGLPGIAMQLGTAISAILFASAATWIGLFIWTSPRRTARSV